MSTAKWNLVLSLASLLGLVAGVARPAFADVSGYANVWWYVDVEWFASASGEVPDPPSGLLISCLGGAFEDSGCGGDSLSVAPGAITSSEQYSVSQTGGFEITNTSDQVIDGGLSLGGFIGSDGASVSVDDPATQYASFVIQSPQEIGEQIWQGCAVGSGPPLAASESGCGFEFDAQGDAFEANLGKGGEDEVETVALIDLDPGASMEIPFTQSIDFDFVVSEPGSLPLLASGLLIGFAVLAPRRRWAAPIRRRLHLPFRG